MKYSLPMPSLGADMDEGKLLEWHIKPGDRVNKGDLIAVVETQKAAVEIESFRTGTVLELIGEIDNVIPVGDAIAILEVEGDVVEEVIKKAEPPVPVMPSAPQPTMPIQSITVTGGERLRVSPAARRLAGMQGIDLTQVTGTGRDGAIQLRDLEQISRLSQKSIATSNSLINVRDAIARVMTRSKREIPHYYLQSQFVVDNLVNWLDTQNRSLPPEQRLFMPAVLMRAIVLALKTNPALNGFYENNLFTPSPAIHLGITVSLKPDGVMTPAIIDAQELSLSALNAAFSDLVQRARAGKLRNREMTDGTITVTNVGDLGADTVTGVIFAPQVALVGLGNIHKAAVVNSEGGLRAGFVVNATLSADHRVTDGLAGSKFLNTLGRLLATPEKLL